MAIQSEGQLFELVQLLRVFGDSKTFPDAPSGGAEAAVWADVEALIGRYAPLLREKVASPEALAGVLDAARLLDELRFELEQLVGQHFDLRGPLSGAPLQSASMEAHIACMWDWLTRRPAAGQERGTLLPLSHPYVVPGGRYVELYYWDSYFTAVGLLAAGRIDLLQGIVDNMTDLIRRYSFVPNGNRSYYLTRSQPPYYGALLTLLGKAQGEDAARVYYETLRREYVYWQTPGAHSVEPAAGMHLNRFWDEADTPRPEGYREDLATWYAARAAGLPEMEKPRLWRDLRAAAESGWDFSSRWLKPDAQGVWSLASIRTTAILPIDLNCLLYSMECQLAAWAPDAATRHNFAVVAERRRELLLRPPFWNGRWFYDVEFIPGQGLAATGVESLAGVFPLFCEVASPEQAAQVADYIEAHFLQAGGVVTSTRAFHTGQQWDYPNGWAPLQWAAVVGLTNYGYDALAREIARRFVAQARRVYDRSGKMMEKYDVCDLTRPGGGGEYPNQDGFGWTNGVVKACLEFLDGNVFWPRCTG
ncbi:MAG TPA: trehalase family glycosidase [Anaerolineae bacterium]|nr:trehalase family glycosidase [Anaerolineae bacterium]